MPCRSYEADEAPSLLPLLDEVTSMLCELCVQVEKENPKKLTGRISQWWNKHKEDDAKEKARLKLLHEAKEAAQKKKDLEEFERLKKKLGM